MQQLLDSIVAKNRKWLENGKVASYIPELANADRNILGITVIDENGKIFSAGDFEYKFTLQSITKVITLMLALMENGAAKVFENVGMEPTGDPFNSIIRLETIKPSKPLNPMINAGAISVVSLLSGNADERINKILSLVHKITGNKNISVNEKLYHSENETGNLNRSLAYYMKNYGVIKGNVDEHLEVYFKQSSIEVTSVDVAKIGVVLANKGKDIATGEEIIPADIVRIVKTFMVTCGMYNASGEFAINVGIPSKSGVGGGILSVVPERYGIGVIGPSLDDKGNSIAGVKVLEELSRELNLSIF